MKEFQIFKLKFKSPLHINTMRDDSGYSLKTIHSDTLYAAIISCLAKTGVEIPDNGDLGFTVSSLFPFYQKGEEECIYFMPMPLQAKLPQLKDVSKAKTIKKIQWIDSNIYGKVLSGENIFDGTSEYFADIHGSYLTNYDLSSIENEFIVSEISQRVKIESRIGEKDALPYYVDRVTFKDNAGLFFLVEGDASLLEKGLNILSNEGLGTDRNVGFGYFEFSKSTLSIELPPKADELISLSVFIPESPEQLNDLLKSDYVAYDFNRRGGWITNYPYQTLRKNAIYAFMPGSVFAFPNINNVMAIGKMVDLRPGNFNISHPIWRCGKSIVLPILIH